MNTHRRARSSVIGISRCAAIVAALVAGSAVAARAQLVTVGDTVLIQHAGSFRTEGILAQSDSTLIRVRTYAGDRETVIARSEIEDVHQRRGSHRIGMPAVLVGAGVGAVAGAVAGYASGDDANDHFFALSRGAKAQMGAAAFGVLGLLVGSAVAFVEEPTWIHVAPPDTSLRIVPSHGGVSIGVAWRPRTGTGGPSR